MRVGRCWHSSRASPSAVNRLRRCLHPRRLVRGSAWHLAVALVDPRIFRGGVGIFLICYCSAIRWHGICLPSLAAAGSAMAGRVDRRHHGTIRRTDRAHNAVVHIAGLGPGHAALVFQSFNLTMQILTMASYLVSGTVTAICPYLRCHGAGVDRADIGWGAIPDRSAPRNSSGWSWDCCWSRVFCWSCQCGDSCRSMPGRRPLPPGLKCARRLSGRSPAG